MRKGGFVFAQGSGKVIVTVALSVAAGLFQACSWPPDMPALPPLLASLSTFLTGLLSGKASSKFQNSTWRINDKDLPHSTPSIRSPSSRLSARNPAAMPPRKVTGSFNNAWKMTSSCFADVLLPDARMVTGDVRRLRCTLLICSIAGGDPPRSPPVARPAGVDVIFNNLWDIVA